MENLIVKVGEQEFTTEFVGKALTDVLINGNIYQIETLNKIDEKVYSLTVNKHVYHIEFDMDRSGDGVIYLDGMAFDVEITNEQRRMLREFIKKAHSSNGSGLIKLKAPMPGMVVKIPVKEGDKVNKGEPIIIIEAMKMENALGAPATGIVKKVHVSEGKPVEKDAPLIEIKEE